MNRAFKRLTQGGILNASDTVIKFTFEGKTYSALQGDTIEVALLSHNILNYGRSKSGYFLTSATNLYPAITTIEHNNQNYHIAMRDFMVTDGLKLSQTNKRSIKDSLRRLSQFLASHQPVPEPIIPITADAITRFLIDNTQASETVKKFSDNMIVNVEKSYIHSDVVITGTNIFALQTALICANAGLKVVLCDTKQDVAYSVFYDSELQATYQALKTQVDNHHAISFKKMTDISLLYDENDKHKQGKIIGLNRQYAYQCFQNDDHNNNYRDVALSVIDAKKIFVTPALQEMGFLFQGHHLSAVMGCREFIDLRIKFGLLPKQNVVLYVSNDMAYDVLALESMTPDNVNAIIDVRTNMTQTMKKAERAGYKIYAGYVVTHATGKEAIESVTFKSIHDDKDGLIKSVTCDLLLQSSGYELDVSLFDNIPQALKISVSDKGDTALRPDLDNVLGNHGVVIGYNFHEQNKNHTDSVYSKCHEFLKACDISVPNYDDTLLQPNATAGIMWQRPEFYDVHDIAPKENILFPHMIQYVDFIQILYQHDNPLTALDALKQNHNFYGNHHAIRILFAKMHQIYDFKPEQIAEFYQQILQKLSYYGLPSGREITHKFSVCRNPKLHILPFNDNTIINQSHIMQTPDYDMSAQHIQEYYHSIKNNVGIRAFNDRDMLDISGSDAIDFLKQIAPDFKNIAVGKHCFIHDKHCKTPILLFQYAPERFCAIMSDKAEFSKTAWQHYQENHHAKIALHKVNQSWAHLQLVGDKAIEIFEKIVKMPVTAIPHNHVSVWIENIQLRFVMYQRYNIQHIDMMIASDAAMSFYQKLTDTTLDVRPFSQPIYDMIALEAGHIFDMPLTEASNATQEKSFTTQALAIPLINPLLKSDISLLGADIYSDSTQTSETPQGIMLPNMIFSPHYNQYVVPSLLQGELQQWENKVVSVVTKDKQHSMQVKIISDKMLKIQEVA